MLAEKLGGTRVIFVYLGMKQSACTTPKEVVGTRTSVLYWDCQWCDTRGLHWGVWVRHHVDIMIKGYLVDCVPGLCPHWCLVPHPLAQKRHTEAAQILVVQEFQAQC